MRPTAFLTYVFPGLFLLNSPAVYWVTLGASTRKEGRAHASLLVWARSERAFDAQAGGTHFCKSEAICKNADRKADLAWAVASSHFHANQCIPTGPDIYSNKRLLLNIFYIESRAAGEKVRRSAFLLSVISKKGCENVKACRIYDQGLLFHIDCTRLPLLLHFLSQRCPMFQRLAAMAPRSPAISAISEKFCFHRHHSAAVGYSYILYELQKYCEEESRSFS